MGRSKKHSRKRSDSSSRSASPPQANPISGSSDSILGELRKLSDNINLQGNNLSNQVQGVASKIDAMDSRLSGVEQNLGLCQSTLSKHENEIQPLFKRIRDIESNTSGLEKRAKDLESRMAIAEQTEFDSSNSNFDRPPNPTIIKANAKVLLSKDAITSAFASLVEKVSLKPDCFKVIGSPVAQYFSFQLLGAPNLARDRAQKILQSLRAEDGSWDRFLVKDPAGSLVQVFLGPDKSPKQIRVEVLSKKLSQILESKGFKEVHANRRQGQVCVGWRPLVMVDVLDRDHAELLWDAAYAAQLKVKVSEICTEFRTSAPSGAASAVKWERLTES